MPNGAMRDNLSKIVDNLLRICEPDGMKNPALMIETLELLKNYDIEFRGLLTVTDKQNNFTEGFEQFLFSQDKVGLKPNELDAAKLYIQQNLQAEVGLWSEADVAEKLKDWRLSTMVVTPTPVVDPDPEPYPYPPVPPTPPEPKPVPMEKVKKAQGRVKGIKSLDEAKRLLNRLTELGIEDVLEVLIND